MVLQKSRLSLEDVEQVITDPYKWAREEKQAGKKVFGVVPMYFPEELLHAAGLLPITLQGSNEPVTYGYSLFYPYLCGFTRSSIDWAVRGKMDFFDGFAYGHMCTQSYRMYQTLRYMKPRLPFFYFQWPLEASDRFTTTCVERLTRLKQNVEAFAGRKIDDATLKNSIALYNRYRALMRRLLEIRKKKPGAIKAREMSNLVRAGMLMPKEDYIEFLEGVVPKLTRRKAASDGKVKVYLGGYMCYPLAVDLLDLIEEAGGVVVEDDLYVGHKYFASDASLERPPIEAFAHRYLNLAIPCPTRTELKLEWGDYVVKTAKEREANGVIILIARQCGPHLLYHSFMKDVLDASKLPHLDLQVEHEVVSLESVRTRIEAFIEMLSRRK